MNPIHTDNEKDLLNQAIADIEGLAREISEHSRNSEQATTDQVAEDELRAATRKSRQLEERRQQADDIMRQGLSRRFPNG